MKAAFSSSVCPSWSLETILDQARTTGYQGVELASVEGREIAPDLPALAGDPASVRHRFADAGIELLCLGTPLRLCGRAGSRAAASDARAFLDLAAQLGCPFVRVFAGTAPARGGRDAWLRDVAARLRQLAQPAADENVTLVIENDADCPGSRDLWYLLDATDHPSVACCWNPCPARRIGERATLSVPRLAARLRLVHICDGLVDDRGTVTACAPPGEGHMELARLVALVRGIGYDGYVVFDQPARQGLPSPPVETVLPAAAAFLKTQFEARGEVLAAYKGDKTAPRFAPRPAARTR